MCVLTSSEHFIWNISPSKKQWARYDTKHTLVFMQGTLYFCHILMRLEFSRQASEKFSNIKFHENPFGESRVVPCGRTDMTKLIVAFRNFPKTPTNTSIHSHVFFHTYKYQPVNAGRRLIGTFCEIMRTVELQWGHMQIFISLRQIVHLVKGVTSRLYMVKCQQRKPYILVSSVHVVVFGGELKQQR